jgi:hypothetical protein
MPYTSITGCDASGDGMPYIGDGSRCMWQQDAVHSATGCDTLNGLKEAIIALQFPRLGRPVDNG